MNKLLTLLAAFICISATAQVKIITAVDTSLYVGIDNPVTIQSTTIPLSELKLRSGNEQVPGKDGHYIIKCSKAGSALLEVVHNNKTVATKKIKINRINDPVVYALGEIVFTDSIITKKQLAAIKSLIVKFNYPLENFSVVSFTTEIIHDGKSTGTLQSSGRNISPDIQKILSYAVAGDEVIFDAIGIRSPDSTRKFVPAIRFKVI